MTDFFLELSKTPQLRELIKTLGLPLPMPEPLSRLKGPWQAQPLQDQRIAVAGDNKSLYTAMIAETLAVAGANPYLMEDSLQVAFRVAGEAYGRPARTLDSLDAEKNLHAIVLDASGLEEIDALETLHAVFQPLVGRLRRSGRVVVIGQALQDLGESELVATQAALEGFTRSLAKEIGRKGATANLLRIAEGAGIRAVPVLRFLLSAQSAFVTAQPIEVDLHTQDAASPIVWEHVLDRKIALVTGAARGIGKETAIHLAQEGAHVVCLDRPEEEGPLSHLAREISGTPLPIDLIASHAPETIADTLRKKGGVDIVVHNAGITRDKTISRMKAEMWKMVLDVNLAAVVRLHRHLREDVLREGGRVICLSSVAGIAGNIGQTAYAASKAGIIGFVEREADHLAHRGITVNAVAPGFIETRLTAAIPLMIREAGRRLSALGQGGLPEDIAQTITFLASAGAQGITGRTLRVCGGALIGA